MNTKINLNEILIRSSLAALKLQREDGSFPEGHNGPWNDLDTPVRVTANWSILLLKGYTLTRDNKIRNAAMKAGEYLSNKKCRPHGFSFLCRKTKNKNKCNGLIGQAWAIEALIELGKELRMNRCLQIAEEIIMKHHFNKKHYLWHNLEIDGNKLNINRTLNQQIWFSVMAYKIFLLTGNETIGSNVTSFFQSLPKHIHFNGKYITHLIHPLSNFLYKEEAKGYLSFLLMGLSHLEDFKEQFISKKTLDQIINSIEYLNKNLYGLNSKFCWSYNPTGFEVAVALYKMKLDSSIDIDYWVSEQVNRHLNFKSNLMDLNTCDRNTLSARIYESTFLPNVEVELLLE
ncbi:hypothetical protein ACFLQ6_07520 [Thermoproteota archaeon]